MTEQATGATATPAADRIVVRQARPDDLASCVEVWRAGLDDYGARVSRPPMTAAPATLLPLLGHLRATDPERFVVAVRAEPGGHEAVVGFAAAIRRADVWFLAMLFVHPAEQARGLGRSLLEAVRPRDDATCLATCTDAAQPVSNALYARLGIVPRLPVLELVGYPDASRLAGLPGSVRAVPFEILGDPGGGDLAAVLAALDRQALGYAHPEDHAFVAASGRLGYLYVAGDGRAVGYGYTSRVGRVGPVAVEDEALLPGVLGHLLGAVEPAGAFAAWVPGAAGRAVTALLDAGLRLEDFPALLCWTRPFGDFSRYVPITLAVP